MTNIRMSLKYFFIKFSKKIQKIVNLILLNAIYFFGIGPTALIAKIVNKQFLESQNKSKSSWKKLTPSVDEKMY